MNRFFRSTLLTIFLWPAIVVAVPQCDEIFTDPPTGEHDPGLIPPDDIGPALGDFTCRKQGQGTSCTPSDEFTPGDYDFSDGDFKQGSYIETDGTTTRLYFDNLSLNAVRLNEFGKAEDLLIYVRDDMQIAGQTYIKGIVYVAGSVRITGQATIDGALASGGELDLSGQGELNFDPDALDEVDFGGMCNNRPEPPTNHYRIEFTSGAISCAPKTVTVKACGNESCTTPSALGSTATFTKDSEAYQALRFTGQTEVEVWHEAGGTVLLGLDNTVPEGEVRCYIDNNQVDISACHLIFEDSGLFFDVPNTLSCKTSTEFELFAVEKDSQTQECQPLFANTTKQIGFEFYHQRPNPVSNDVELTLNSLHAPAASETLASTSQEELAVTFDADGRAKLTINYPEAGVINLAANYTHVESTPDGGSETIELTHSDDFTAYPAGFHFYNADGVTGSSEPTGHILAKAGEDFEMNFKAVCWGENLAVDYSNGVPLQNFELSDVAIKPQLLAPLIANGDPEDGTLGSVARKTVNFVQGANAPVQLTDQTYSEVGAIAFELSDNLNYEGVVLNKANTGSETFGRFTPAYLEITANTPELVASCNSVTEPFTYMDQPFGFNVGVEPSIEVAGINVSGAETRNYQIGDWWRYKATDVANRNSWSGREYLDKTMIVDIKDHLAPALSGSISYLSAPNKAQLIDAQVQYVRTPTPVPPFEAKFDLILAVEDVTDEDGICFQDSAANACRDFTFEDIGQDQQLVQRYGRMVLENSFGPDSEVLRVPLRSEYVTAVTGNNPTWVTNNNDNCSLYNTETSSDSGEDSTAGLYMLLPTGVPSVDAYTEPSLTFQQGSLLMGSGFSYLTAPNKRGEVELKQHVEPWLKWFWNYEGTQADKLYDPRASAYFGTYRGHDKVIYWREID